MWFVCLILKQQFYIHINWNYKSSLSTSLKLKLAEASHILIFLNPEFSSLYQIFEKMRCTAQRKLFWFLTIETPFRSINTIYLNPNFSSWDCNNLTCFSKDHILYQQSNINVHRAARANTTLPHRMAKSLSSKREKWKYLLKIIA